MAWSGSWPTRRTTTGATARRSLAFLALLQLSLMLRLLDCIPLLGTGFQYRLGLRQSHQAILSPCDLFAHHQPVRHLWLLTLFDFEQITPQPPFAAGSPTRASACS